MDYMRVSNNWIKHQKKVWEIYGNQITENKRGQEEEG